jgi:3-dehydroquinate synthase class II
MADDWEEPEDLYRLDLYFNWQLPSLASPPDLLVVGTDLAGVGGVDLPIKVAAAESIASITDASERTVQVVGQCQVSLVDVLMGREQLCEELDRAKAVSEYLLDRVTGWMEPAG